MQEELASPGLAGTLVDLTDGGGSSGGPLESARASARSDVQPTCEPNDAAPHAHDATALLEQQFSLMTAMLTQLERLRQSVSFEERRLEDNPLLPILRAVLKSLDDEMAARTSGCRRWPSSATWLGSGCCAWSNWRNLVSASVSSRRRPSWMLRSSRHCRSLRSAAWASSDRKSLPTHHGLLRL